MLPEAYFIASSENIPDVISFLTLESGMITREVLLAGSWIRSRSIQRVWELNGYFRVVVGWTKEKTIACWKEIYILWKILRKFISHVRMVNLN